MVFEWRGGHRRSGDLSARGSVGVAPNRRVRISPSSGSRPPTTATWIPARSTIAQCRAAGVSVFVKQVGAKPVNGKLSHRFVEVPLRDRKGGDWSEWPEDLRVREFPPC
jgi:hypothetical protein